MEKFSATTTNNIVGFILLVTVIVMEMNISLQQHCLPLVSSQTGFALTGFVYKSFTAKDYPTCLMECKRDERCMSLNYHILKHTCELSTQTKESTPSLYITRPNSIYSTNTAFRTPAPLQGTKERPAKSCLEILVTGNSVGTGEYWIDPTATGNPIKAYCDMDTDGGGWTIVKRTILPSGHVQPWLKLRDLNVIAEFARTDVWIIPKTDAMLDIKNKMGFHQIHFYCYKKSVGRVVSIMTKNNTAGQDVVTFFTTPSGAATVFPTACGSFDRLPEDTSLLSRNCDKWGTSEPAGGGYPLLSNQWGYYTFHGGARLGALPFQMNLPPGHFYGGSNGPGEGALTSCDDQRGLASEPPSPKDTWQISVR